MLCILHLETLDVPVTAAERAFLLGNSPEAIIESADISGDQGQAWSRSALEARDSDPETATVNLSEARAWSRDASQAAEALAFVNNSQAAAVTFTFDPELDEIRRQESAWLRVHAACEAKWNETENCPVHGPEIRAGIERQRQATFALREALDAAMRAAKDRRSKGNA